MGSSPLINLKAQNYHRVSTFISKLEKALFKFIQENCNITLTLQYWNKQHKHNKQYKIRVIEIVINI